MSIGSNTTFFLNNEDPKAIGSNTEFFLNNEDSKSIGSNTTIESTAQQRFFVPFGRDVDDGLTAQPASGDTIVDTEQLTTAFLGALSQQDRTTTQSLANSTDVVITYDTNEFDTSTFWNAANPDRFTAPLDGRYLLEAQVAWSDDSNGNRQIEIIHFNSSDVEQRRITFTGKASSVASPPTIRTIAGLFEANATDYFVVSTFQDSGSSLTTFNDTSFSEEPGFNQFSIEWLR